MHATPLHDGIDVSSDSDKENKNEKLEMTTFGKKDSKKYKGDHIIIIMHACMDFLLLPVYLQNNNSLQQELSCP